MQLTLSHHLAARFIIACAVLWLVACVPTQDPASGPASADRAERFLRQGNAVAAAQMYGRLASQNPPPASVDFALEATRAWLTANRADDAQRALDAIASEPNAEQQFERELLRADTALARGQYAPAWRQISAVPEPRKAADAARLFQMQQRVALRAGQPLDAVRAGMAADRVAQTDADRQRARRDLLTDLRGAIDRGLRVDAATAREPLVRGWLEIAQIAAIAGHSPLSANAAIDRWRSRYPGHPAGAVATSEILTPAVRPIVGNGASVAANTAPVGLLLPLSGRQSAAATLIRDGFMAAINRLPEGTRPQVRIYDTAAIPVETAMQTAQSEGAGFLVGPLTREEIQSAANSRPASLPMLLLNNLASGSYGGAPLYQYALSPEDEARQIARQLQAAGQGTVAVLAPAGDWGNRVATAFADELVRAGGQVATQASYDLTRNDLTVAVTQALGVDASRARYKRVQQITATDLVFDPRPRPDIRAVFAAGYQPLAMRQINPQLRFFNAGGLPTYMTQDGLDADTNANRDLEGMRLVDMPWMLETTGQTADTRTATASQWSARGQRQSRYFAFGFDAASLTIALRSNAPVWPLDGLTGRLNLTAEGRIERGLEWARMRDGVPRLYDPVTQ
jgi:outer membrane PBP1 activator LpoA protein